MKLLTVSGAARRARRAEATVRRWADTGRLVTAARLDDGTRLFRAGDVDAAAHPQQGGHTNG